MVPRISMIVAMDTDGEVFLSLVQANSNAKIIEIFIRQLVLKLDARDANWRNTSLITQLDDEAQINVCTDTQAIILVSSYSYGRLGVFKHNWAGSPTLITGDTLYFSTSDNLYLSFLRCNCKNCLIDPFLTCNRYKHHILTFNMANIRSTKNYLDAYDQHKIVDSETEKNEYYSLIQ